MNVTKILLVFLLLPITAIAERQDEKYFEQFAPKNAANSQANQKAPQAEDIVTFKEHTFACDSKEHYEIFISHLEKGESTLAKSMIKNYSCSLIPKTEKYKILSVEYGAFSQFIQFTNEKNESSGSGFWTKPGNVSEIKNN